MHYLHINNTMNLQIMQQIHEKKTVSLQTQDTTPSPPHMPLSPPVQPTLPPATASTLTVHICGPGLHPSLHFTGPGIHHTGLLGSLCGRWLRLLATSWHGAHSKALCKILSRKSAKKKKRVNISVCSGQCKW